MMLSVLKKNGYIIGALPVFLAGVRRLLFRRAGTRVTGEGTSSTAGTCSRQPRAVIAAMANRHLGAAAGVAMALLFGAKFWIWEA